MRKSVRQYSLLICFFIFYWVFAFSNWVIKVNTKDYFLNLVQVGLLFVIFINLYFFLEMLVGKKMDVIVEDSLTSKKISFFSFLALDVRRYFFYALIPSSGRTVVLSKFCGKVRPTTGTPL